MVQYWQREAILCGGSAIIIWKPSAARSISWPSMPVSPVPTGMAPWAQEAAFSAVPVADPKYQMERIPLKGEIPNPANPPSGCYFHERCQYCIDKCVKESPVLKKMPDGRLCACHRAEELSLRGFSYEE